MMTIGIYAIRNRINNKVYVGSSINIELRWGQHRSMLRSGRHHSSHLQNAWNVYGEDGFEFIILKKVESSEYLLTEEQEEIVKRQSYLSDFGYNMTKVVHRVHALALGLLPESQAAPLPLPTPTRKLVSKLEELIDNHNPPLSQRKLSRETGLSMGAIQRLCHNDMSRLDANTLEVLCEYFDCELNDVIDLTQSS